MELGQLLHGNPAQDFDCPAYIIALLERLGDEICRVRWNIDQREFSSPFSNTGSRFETDVFKVRAYYWGDDEAEVAIPNFQYPEGNIYISWYKHARRGPTINRIPEPTEVTAMFDRCMASIEALERSHSDDKQPVISGNRYAPFMPDEIANLNDYQRADPMYYHPFTCNNGHLLVATPAGWRCPTCEDYRQNWAHEWMADGTWRHAAEEMERAMGQLFNNTETEKHD